MRDGARAYADIIYTLADAGLPTTFIQTGGMYALLQAGLAKRC